MATDVQREQILSEAIGEISHIATLPEITLKIIELVEDPSSTAQDLHNLISIDPALCSRVLKVVNSSFYGLPGQIASINRAIVMLGLNAVKNIAIAASLAKLFRGGQLTPYFAARDLWDHSIASAAATKLLADKLGYGLTDEAFLAGLIHDIGFMVEMQYDRNKMIDVLDRVKPDTDGVPSGDMLEAEAEIFGVTHQEFGFALCERWKFPKTLASVTRYHHNPSEAPSEHRTLCNLVYVADRISAEHEKGFRLDLPSLEYDKGVLEQLGLSSEQLATIREEFPSALEDISELIG
ncbi:MAG: HDOD domain-containing protein [Planctomycetota bacterium]